MDHEETEARAEELEEDENYPMNTRAQQRRDRRGDYNDDESQEPPRKKKKRDRNNDYEEVEDERD